MRRCAGAGVFLMGLATSHEVFKRRGGLSMPPLMSFAAEDIALPLEQTDHEYPGLGEIQEEKEQQPAVTFVEVSHAPSLLSLLVPDALHWGAAGAAAILNAVATLQIPRVIGRLVEELGESEADLTEAFVLLLGFVALQGAASYVLSSELRTATESFSARLKTEMFESLLHKELGYYDEHSSGALLSQMSSDVSVLQEASYRVVKSGFQAVGLTLGGMYSLYSISPTLTMLLGGAVPVYLGVGSLWGRYIRGMLRRARDHSAAADGHAQERISNISTIRAFNAEAFEIKQYEKRVAQVRDEYLVANRHVGLFLGAASMMGTALIGTCLFAGSQWDPSLTVSGLTAFMMTASHVQGAVGALFALSQEVNGATVSWERCHEMMMEEPALRDARATLRASELVGKVSWEGVDFSYPSRKDAQILSAFTLEVPAGKTVAFVGPSGSGKSTVLKLVQRLYEPDVGQLTLDGVALQDLDPSEVRSYIGVVDQKPVLWSGSIRDNISYGDRSASFKEIKEAARQANADEFITKLPQGYDTQLGEGGTQLSGGQIQRLAIARAIVKKPRILILDEASSALDTQSEAKVVQALDRVMEGRTVFVIAHRLSTVRNADLIVVMENGKVKEQGTHDELMKAGGLYAALVQMQLE